MSAKANAISSRSRSKWPELVQEATDWITRAFVEKGMGNDAAESCAVTAIDALTGAIGGQLIYFPLAARARSDERNRRIQKEFTGNNQGELARKHGVSVQHVYRITKKTGDPR
jgi:Mor family transcriptional regulator